MIRVLVIGGAGFIGRSLCAKLAAAGCRVTVPTRYPEQARSLRVLPWLQLVQADIQDDGELGRLLDGQDVVINLVGILQGRAGTYELHGRRYDVGPDFGRAHIGLVDRLVRLMPAGGRLVQVSALGCGAAEPARLPSRYLRSKAAGEALIEASSLAWTLIRPSVVFGEQDHFLNTFAAMQRWLPVIALPNASARFQPIWVEDLAAGLAATVVDPRAGQTVGQRLDAVGPVSCSLREIVTLAGEACGHRRPIIALPGPVSTVLATLMEIAPGPTPMSRDNIASMKLPNVSADDAPRLLPLFGIVPRFIEEVAPGWLSRRGTYYDRLRRRGRR